MRLDELEVSVARLRMLPGDTVLVSTHSRLSGAEIDAICTEVDRVLPPGVKALILSKGLSLEVIPAKPLAPKSAVGDSGIPSVDRFATAPPDGLVGG